MFFVITLLYTFRLKINEEKRSKTKNKNKTNLTPKKGRKRKLLEMSTELDTEEPVPSTSRSTIPKKKKGNIVFCLEFCFLVS